jgi:DNA-binding transcriptional LysR family regulator
MTSRSGSLPVAFFTAPPTFTSSCLCVSISARCTLINETCGVDGKLRVDVKNRRTLLVDGDADGLAALEPLVDEVLRVVAREPVRVLVHNDSPLVDPNGPVEPLVDEVPGAVAGRLRSRKMEDLEGTGSYSRSSAGGSPHRTGASAPAGPARRCSVHHLRRSSRTGGRSRSGRKQAPTMKRFR